MDTTLTNNIIVVKFNNRTITSSIEILCYYTNLCQCNLIIMIYMPIESIQRTYIVIWAVLSAYPALFSTVVAGQQFITNCSCLI